MSKKALQKLHKILSLTEKAIAQPAGDNRAHEKVALNKIEPKACIIHVVNKINVSKILTNKSIETKALTHHIVEDW